MPDSEGVLAEGGFFLSCTSGLVCMQNISLRSLPQMQAVMGREIAEAQ